MVRKFWVPVMNSWYCSERPGSKGRATPYVVVHYTQTVHAGGSGGLLPGYFRPS